MYESSLPFGNGDGSSPSQRSARIAVETSFEPDGTAMIAVAGELDLSSARQLNEALEEVASSNAHALVLDLGGVTFMDSSGIHALVGATERMDSVGLRRPSRQVQRILEVSGLGQLFPTEA